MKKGMSIIAIILCVAMCFTACQPTPEVEPVVNKREDVRQEAIKETPAPTQTGETAQPPEIEHFEPVAYKTSQRWTEEIKKGEKFIVRADIDVQVPDVEKFPVVKLRKATFTQQQVDDMIAKLIPGEHTYYQYPMPNTKEYYEERIVELKQSLARSEAGEDGETPEAIRGYIKEAEADYAAAPEENTLVPATTEFDYSRDYETGEPDLDSGKHEVSLVTNIDGVDYTVSATNDPEYTAYFGVGSTYSTSESDVDMQLGFVEADRARAETMPDDYRDAELLRVQEYAKHWEDMKARMSENKIDLAAMQQKAINIFKSLDMGGVQIMSCERAFYSPRPDANDWEGYENATYDRPGCYIVFVRQIGGVPSVMPQSGGSEDRNDKTATYYAAPFFMETGNMLLDETGNVLDFSWSAPAVEFERVAEDTELLSFDEIKGRAVDHLYYKNSFLTGEGMERMEYEVTQAKLFMGYINAKDDTQSALAVPVWRFSAVGTDIGDGYRYTGYNEEVFVNALDGGIVVLSMPTDMN